MAGSVFYKLGRIVGVQVHKAKWMWESVALNEAEGIRAEHTVGRDIAADVLEENSAASPSHQHDGETAHRPSLGMGRLCRAQDRRTMVPSRS
jgi:hypothetical protein